jgi:hypothetical protein
MNNSGVTQFERRGLRIQGSPASPNGTVNTNILVFSAAAAPIQMTIGGVPGTTTYPIGTTFVAPVGLSGNWINVVANDTASGTGFKFNRKGVYEMTVQATEVAANTTAGQFGITLDQALALDTVAAGTQATLSDSVLAFTNVDGLADSVIPMIVRTVLYITDRLAGGAQPSNDLTTTRGVGVVRVIANDANNGEIADAMFTAASYRATIYGINEIWG